MSEIRVDTISEKTSANGVAIDGVTLKDGAITSTAATTITVADNSDNLTLTSTDADSNSGPNLRLYRNNDSNGDGDVLGQIDFDGRNDNSQDVVYARIRAVAEDITDGTEDARLIIEKAVNGSTTEIMRSVSSETVFNDGSIDLDFRVESNGNANMLFVDGGNDHVNVGTSTDHGGVFNVESTDNAITLLLASTDTDANAGPQLKLLRAVTGATNDICGKIEFGAKDDAGNGEAYALITQKILNAANGSEEARLTFQVMQDGSQRDMLSLDASEVVINEDSRDIDFRVESDSKTHMLFVDSGNDRIGVNTSSPADTMHIKSTGDPSNDIRFILETNATDGNCAIDFRNSASTFKGGILYDTDDNNLQFNVNSSERMRIDSSGNLLLGTTSYAAGQESKKFEPGQIFSSRSTTGQAGHITFQNANGGVGTITTNGSATQYVTSSDYRLKENVVTDWDATTRLKQLKPSRFNFKADADKTVDGFLAHEVSDIVPEAINGEKDETETYIDDDGQQQTRPVYQGIDQSKLVPLLVKTIQELEARITTLEG